MAATRLATASRNAAAVPDQADRYRWLVRGPDAEDHATVATVALQLGRTKVLVRAGRRPRAHRTLRHPHHRRVGDHLP